jgi:MoxR-like ATPase
MGTKTTVDTARKIVDNLAIVIKGKPRVLEHVVATLLAGGNILMEDVPGVGKTTLAKALAYSIKGEFRRIQFTPDLLPADNPGSSLPTSGKPAAPSAPPISKSSGRYLQSWSGFSGPEA